MNTIFRAAVPTSYGARIPERTKGSTTLRWFGCALLLGLAVACSGGLKASGGLKLDTKTGLTAKVDGKASTQAGAEPKSESKPKEAGAALDEALSGSHRSEANRARDRYRHPKETLMFFGLRSDMTVLEVEPGADGWYTEVLAPVLRDHGKYIATNFDLNGPEKSPLTQTARAYRAMLDARPDLYDKVQIVTLDPEYGLGEPNSVDMVVTFRNSHLWKQEKNEARVYRAIFQVLEPGGVFGIVQHRACAGDSASRTVSKGYLPQPYVIDKVQEAGFVFEEESHINANSWDTRDHPKGVWTLPPSLALGDKDREKYEKIGESDRMTLRFRKPVDSASAEPATPPADPAGKPSGTPEAPAADKPAADKPAADKPAADKPAADTADKPATEKPQPKDAAPKPKAPAVPGAPAPTSAPLPAAP